MRLHKPLYTITFLLMMVSCGKDYVPTGYILEVDRGDLVRIPYTFIDPHSDPRKFKLVGVVSPNPDDGSDLREAYFGVLAKNFSDDWSDDREVTLERPFKTSRGLTDRSRGWVKDAATGEFLHEALVDEGLARADFEGEDLGDKGQKILTLEREAQANQKGMWSSELPSEREMKRVIKSNAGLFGQITSLIRPEKEGVTSTPVVSKFETSPAQITTESQQPATYQKSTVSQQPVPALSGPALASSAKLLQTINSEAEVARREFLNWQNLSATDQATQAAKVRQQLRRVKIHVMDAFDEGTPLNDGQRVFLQSLRDEMNRLMLLIPR